ncbi:hypothetical protein BO71DRAFT_433598 [Aspergillus ellipticus CBS 707.79]|uniref:Nephrocystin 3-like N-terminal domain-containing protein n=1 Tax=Aspergillus ellipticus CBS 707.79 TaxID=1448320 RepID=A0A319D100_9EURO|nr:hypothetical protein BO71DRAFT_433598 [Aspergillus ellipticus CBS 707.79]
MANTITRMTGFSKPETFRDSGLMKTAFPSSPNFELLRVPHSEGIMDPITAIGLVSNIIDFVDLGVKLFNDAREIYESASGATKANENHEFMAKGCRSWKCRGLATDIRVLLDEIKSRASGSWSSIAFGVLKARKYDQRIGELQERLKVCQNQDEIHKGLEALVANSNDNSDSMRQLQMQVDSLQRSMSNASSADYRTHLSDLWEISEASYDKFLSNSLISNIMFENMNTRFDEVATAHEDTFQWIFDEDDRDTYQHEFHQSFNSWLSSGDGIFHISGKLGSGKSTLMKMLYDDNRTEKILKEWAGECNLIMARFFFWNAGSHLQKSMEGVFRSLLYESLKSAPELIKEMHAKISFLLHDFREAFSRLVKCGGRHYRICFFIDGLDEYEVSENNGYLEIVQSLCEWSESVEGNIKFCVSSREYNIFMNRFSERQRITMQDLTQGDMNRSIRDKLEDMKEEKIEEFMTLITEKASGVLLWVALVIRRLINLKKREEATLERLKNEIDNVPERLEDLFRHLLQTIDSLDRTRAYKTFTIFQRLQEDGDHPPLPLRSYYFIDDYRMAISDRLVRARKMLMGSCLGLVEPTRTYPERALDYRGYEEWTISFTHRSFPEFLGSLRYFNQEQSLRDFCSESAISRLSLLHLWDRNHLPSADHLGSLSYMSSYIMDIRHKANISKEPFFLEEQLQAAVIRNGDTGIEEEDDYGSIRIRTRLDRVMLLADSEKPLSDEYFSASPLLTMLALC